MLPVETIIEGLFSYKKKAVINYKGITAASVSGSNGVGKSSLIIDPIAFTLFGETREDLADQINEEMNAGYSTFKFLKNNNLYEVTRSIKRLKDGKSTSSLQIIEDGKEYIDRLKRTKQESLNAILGFNKDLLLHTHISCQDETKLLCTINVSKREQILTDLLGFDVWKRKKDKVSEFINLNKSIQETITSKQLAIGEMCLTRDNRRYLIKDAGNNITTLEVDLIQQQLKVDNLSSIIEEAEHQESLKDTKARLSFTIDSLEQRIELSSSSLPTKEELEKEKRLATDLLRAYSLSKNESITSLQAHQAKVTGAEEAMKTALSFETKQNELSVLDTVPCKNTIYFNKCHLLSSAHHFYDELHSYLAEWECTSLDELIEGLNNLITLHTKLAGNYKANMWWEEREIAKLETDLKTYALYEKAHEDVDNLRLELNSAKLQYTKVSQEIIPIGITYGAFQMEQQKLYEIRELLNNEKSLLNELNLKQNSNIKLLQIENDELIELNKKSQKVGLYKTLHQAYNDIPAHLFIDTVPHIEEYANNLLEKILPGRSIEFRTHRDTQNKTQIKSLDILWGTSTGKRKFKTLSGAEQFIASLVLRLAVSWVNCELYNIPFTFFIIDEGFGSLDTENIESVKQVLRSIAPNFELFLIITHVDSLKDTFDTQIIINPESAEERVVILR